jgi:hypothetical protein
VAVAGEVPLVFGHVLRVDKAGHKGDHQAYLAAARGADDLLGQLLQAAPPGPQRRWFVLSDHGHRRDGGHGGARAGVRLVRGCIAGGVGPGQGSVHLVDVSRALADSLGVAVDGVGRPLSFALAQPAPGATLPPWPWARFALALGLLAAVLLSGRRVLGPRWAAAWAWLPVAYAGTALFHGALDLSNPVVYPPLGRDLLLAAGPGFLLLAGWAVVTRATGWPAVGALAPALGGAVAALVGCGGIAALLDAGAGPPLERHTTALGSALLLLAGGGAVALALGLGLGPLLRRLARREPPVGG